MLRMKIISVKETPHCSIPPADGDDTPSNIVEGILKISHIIECKPLVHITFTYRFVEIKAINQV